MLVSLGKNHFLPVLSSLLALKNWNLSSAAQPAQHAQALSPSNMQTLTRTSPEKIPIKQQNLTLRPGSFLPASRRKKKLQITAKLKSNAANMSGSNRRHVWCQQIRSVSCKEENYLLGQFSNYVTQKYFIKYTHFKLNFYWVIKIP